MFIIHDLEWDYQHHILLFMNTILQYLWTWLISFLFSAENNFLDISCSNGSHWTGKKKKKNTEQWERLCVVEQKTEVFLVFAKQSHYPTTTATIDTDDSVKFSNPGCPATSQYSQHLFVCYILLLTSLSSKVKCNPLRFCWSYPESLPQPWM